MYSKPLSLSIIIPAYNEADHLPKVLQSLADVRASVELELIVVDAGSEDETSEIARCLGCRTLSAGRVFPGVARNAGVKVASSEVIAFLDGDVLVTPSWTERVLEILKAPHSLERTLIGQFYGISSSASWIEKVWFQEEPCSAGRYINGGNLLMRRDDFHLLNGFDEKLPTGEDYDFCQRAKGQGMQVLLDSRLKTIHLGYPKTIKEFLIRESWHGSGDFTSLVGMIRSKVAMATVFFLSCLLLFLLSAIFVAVPFMLVGFLGLFFLCLFASAYKWRTAGWRRVVAATPVFFLYFLGRSLAIVIPSSTLARWRSKNR